MPLDTARSWTREEVLALPDDGRRYELIDGELIVTPSPAPPHQFVLTNLVTYVLPYVRAHGIGDVLFSPADLQFERNEILQPDLFVVPPSSLPVRRWTEIRSLLLVVEIASPSSARTDRFRKRRRYQRAGVPEYWVIDPAAQAVERWRPADERAELCDERLVWHPDAAAPPLELEVAALFRGVAATE